MHYIACKPTSVWSVKSFCRKENLHRSGHKPEDIHLQFVNLVIATGRLCEFSARKFEKITGTIVKNGWDTSRPEPLNELKPEPTEASVKKMATHIISTSKNLKEHSISIMAVFTTILLLLIGRICAHSVTQQQVLAK